MPPDVRERIFEPFYTTKPSGVGTGLGLATVHGIVAKAGGSIGVYSEEGMGTTFNVYLPAVADAPGEEAPLPRSQAPVRGNGELILVAEDEDPVRELVERVLTTGGYRVITAGSGDEAMTKAASATEPIDLLLTDVVMPNLSGKTLSDRLGMKTIFMSGYTQQLITEQGVVEEGQTLLQKPFAVRQLLSAVREKLDAR
jgi:two-component system cell cycle sensor histidine kinase/response regulator CckA